MTETRCPRPSARVVVGRDADGVLDAACLQRLVDLRLRKGRVVERNLTLLHLTWAVDGRGCRVADMSKQDGQLDDNPYLFRTYRSAVDGLRKTFGEYGFAVNREGENRSLHSAPEKTNKPERI